MQYQLRPRSSPSEATMHNTDLHLARQKELQSALIIAFGSPDAELRLQVLFKLHDALIAEDTPETRQYSQVNLEGYPGCLVKDAIAHLVHHPNQIPAKKAPTYRAAHAALLEVARKSSIISKDFDSSNSFRDAMWIVAVAVEMKQPEILVEKRALEWTKRQERYKVFVAREREGNATRKELRHRLAAIPAELRIIVFGFLALKLVTTEIWTRDESCFEAAVIETLACLSDQKLIVKKVGKHMVPEFDKPQLQSIHALYRNEVETGIINSIPIVYPAEFPSASLPARLPIPSVLATRQNAIHDLTLMVKIPWFSNTYYPSAIFRLQDNITNIKTWAPKLKTFTIVVINMVRSGRTGSQEKYMARMPRRDLTMMDIEMRVLVEEMKKADVERTMVAYVAGADAGSKGKAAFQGSLVEDVKAEEVAEVVKRLMEGEGVRHMI